MRISKDQEAVNAVKSILFRLAQYTYTVGEPEVLEMVRAVDRVRRKQQIRQLQKQLKGKK